MLYFVSTPIGNLKDMTYRAVEVLSSSDVICCEDTRHSLPLLEHYGIKKQLVSYHKFNEKTATEKITALLDEGKTVSVISDAGTPVLSDPGSILVKELIKGGYEFTVVVGANAVLPALILSGFDSSRFYFVGFLPDKNKDRLKLLESCENVQATLIFYVAPHDIDDIVSSIYSVLGERKAVVVREITKIYESRTEFMLSEGYKGEMRGEMVLLVEGASCENDFSELPIEEHIAMYLSSGLSKMDAIKKVAKERGVPKNTLYKYTINEDK